LTVQIKYYLSGVIVILPPIFFVPIWDIRFIINAAVIRILIVQFNGLTVRFVIVTTLFVRRQKGPYGELAVMIDIEAILAFIISCLKGI